MNTRLATEPGTAIRMSAWTLALGAFAAAAIVLFACYWQTAGSLIHIWSHDGTYQYAFLIFPLSAWVAFDLRHPLRANPPAPSVWGLIAVAVLVLIWYAGHMLDINLPQHFAFVALFPALVLACWGWRAAWTLKFPLAYLVVFAVPWGDSLVGPLQDITARFAVHALNLTGMPVLLNGREIITPSAVWMVEAACSGVKFFIACTALGSLFAYLMYNRARKRVVFVLVSAVAPVIANGLRVYFEILIGETFGLKYATGADHMIFGWQFFGTVLLVLFIVGWFFRDRPVARGFGPLADDKPTSVRLVAWPVALVLLVAGPVFAAAFAAPATTMDALHLAAPSIAGWHGPQPAAGEWRPNFKGAAGQVQATYQSATGGSVIELFHAVYLGKPRRGHDLITYGNDVYDPMRQRVLATHAHAVHFVAGAGVTARELRLVDADGARLVWYWYCVDHRCTASPVLVKLLQAWDVVRGRTPRSSVWALSLPVANSNTAQARRELLAFARAVPVSDTVDSRLKHERAAAEDPR